MNCLVASYLIRTSATKIRYNSIRNSKRRKSGVKVQSNIFLDIVHGGPRIPSSWFESRSIRYPESASQATGIIDQVCARGTTSFSPDTRLSRKSVSFLAQNPSLRFGTYTEWKSFPIRGYLLRLRPAQDSYERPIRRLSSIQYGRCHLKKGKITGKRKLNKQTGETGILIDNYV